MIVSIILFGLELEAEVEIISTPRRATLYEPEEYLEIEVTDLTFNGVDASFLLRSDELRATIEDKAWDATVEHLKAEELSRGEDLAQQRAEDALYT